MCDNLKNIVILFLRKMQNVEGLGHTKHDFRVGAWKYLERCAIVRGWMVG